ALAPTAPYLKLWDTTPDTNKPRRSGAAERIRVAEKKRTNSRVRYARVGDLREAGFAVVHTPGRVAGGVHCSVVFPSFDPLVEQAIPWPDKVSDEFDRCFEGEGLIKGKRS